MNAYRIRHIEPADAEAMHELMSHAETFSTMLGLPFPSLDAQRKRLASPPANGHLLVAVNQDDKVLAWGGLMPLSGERRRHVHELGLGVHRDWQGQGVGRALMAALLELADHWLGLRRVELTVFCDNLRAQALYRKFGFEEEGRLRAYALRDGEYRDVLQMSRLRLEGGA